MQERVHRTSTPLVFHGKDMELILKEILVWVIMVELVGLLMMMLLSL